jgi:hypothetical protein
MVCRVHVVSTLLSVCALAGCGGTIARDDGLGAGTEPGSAGGPVVDHVEPNTGPNSGGTSVHVSGSGFALDGGTQFTFGGTPATHVTCTSDTACVVVTPPAGFATRTQAVDVQASVGSGKPGALTSATTGNDVFTYAAGPDCSTAQVCEMLGVPRLLVTCPSQVTFFQLGPPDSMVGTGTSYTSPMNCGSLAACDGSPSSGSCSRYSLVPPAVSCGDPWFCDKCSKAGLYCTSGPSPLCCNGVTCTGVDQYCH